MHTSSLLSAAKASFFHLPLPLCASPVTFLLSLFILDFFFPSVHLLFLYQFSVCTAFYLHLICLFFLRLCLFSPIHPFSFLSRCELVVLHRARGQDVRKQSPLCLYKARWLVSVVLMCVCYGESATQQQTDVCRAATGTKRVLLPLN